MTVGEMLILTNRLNNICASSSKRIKNARLEVFMLDIGDAYVQDPFAEMIYTAAYEQKN